MAQIRMVGPLYIDHELEPKKIETFVQNAPLGGPDPHFGTPNMKTAWTVIFLAGNLLKFDIGVPEIDFS